MVYEIPYDIPHEDCPEQNGVLWLKIAKANGTNIYFCDKCGARKEIKEK